MLRKTFTLLGVLIILVSFFTLSKPVFAANTSLAFQHVLISAVPSLPSSMKTKATPLINCPSGANALLYANGNLRNPAGCFYGTGYWSFQIDNVNDIVNYGRLNMWIRYYHGGPGYFCTIPPGGNAFFEFGGSTHYEVTQLDYGAQKGGICPHR